MASYFGKHIHVSVFGQSHAPAIGVTVDGLPAGEAVDLEELQRFLQRRAPGRDATSTPRKEGDVPKILCGLVDNITCGAPLAAVIENTNTRSKDYDELRDKPRPAHADFTAQVKYGGTRTCGGAATSPAGSPPPCVSPGALQSRSWLAGASTSEPTSAPSPTWRTGPSSPWGSPWRCWSG